MKTGDASEEQQIRTRSRAPINRANSIPPVGQILNRAAPALADHHPQTKKV
jgi:hypothetical protein